MPNSATSKMSLLRALPSVDQLLRTEWATAVRSSVGAERITALARTVTEELRREIQAEALADPDAEQTPARTREALLDEAVRRLDDAWKRDRLSGLRRVINATGVIVHTNLGRAPLSEAARSALVREAGGYCNVEYDVTTGTRGRRGARVEDLLIELTGAEDALVVNNCAAAALLILTVLAKDGETIVSGGELVEIGGDFRVPDVMANSGTRMIEVGTTNRTKLDDYRQALNEKTRLIMRVHQSNYRIIGFTTSPTRAETSALAHEAGLALYEDAGSGVLADLSQYGLTDEPVISECISDGADVVSFSGDKLLGSTQAGLIVGRHAIVGRLRKHPRQEIEKRARSFLQRYPQRAGSSGLTLEIVAGTSAIGGGSGPNTHPPTTLLALSHPDRSADDLEQALRSSSPAIITRIAEGRVLIDLRTVDLQEETEILNALVALTS